MNRQRDVQGSRRFKFRHEPPSVGNHQRDVTGGHQRPGNFQRPSLDATGIQFGKYLEYFHQTAKNQRLTISSAHRPAS